MWKFKTTFIKAVAINRDKKNNSFILHVYYHLSQQIKKSSHIIPPHWVVPVTYVIVCDAQRYQLSHLSLYEMIEKIFVTIILMFDLWLYIVGHTLCAIFVLSDVNFQYRWVYLLRQLVQFHVYSITDDLYGALSSSPTKWHQYV